MEKEPTSSTESLPPLVIYADDFEDLVRIISGVCRSYYAKLTVGEEAIKIDKLEEIDALTKEYDSPIHDLEICGTDPYISLDLRSHSAEIYISTRDTRSLGLVMQLTTLLRRKIPRMRLLKYMPLLYIISGVWLFMYGVFILGKDTDSFIKGTTHPVSVLVLIATFIASFVLLLIARINWSNRFNRYTTLILKRRSESQSFIVRNKDTILLQALNTLLSVLVGGVVTYFIAKK